MRRARRAQDPPTRATCRTRRRSCTKQRGFGVLHRPIAEQRQPPRADDLLGCHADARLGRRRARRISLPTLRPKPNSSGTAEIKAAAVQSPIAGLIAKAQSLLRDQPAELERLRGPAICGAGDRRVADRGLVRQGLAARGQRRGDRIRHDRQFLAGSFARHVVNTNDQALLDVITNLQNLAAVKGVKTYIIGVGAGVDPTVNPAAAATMQAMAIAGGTGTASATGYFAANSPQQVTNDLQIIITKILAATQSVASAARQLDRPQHDFRGVPVAVPDLGHLPGLGRKSVRLPHRGRRHREHRRELPSGVRQAQLDAQGWDARTSIATWDPDAQRRHPVPMDHGTPARTASPPAPPWART